MTVSLRSVLLSLLAATVISHPKARAEESPQSSVQLVKKFVTASENKDLESAASTMAENVTFFHPMTYSGQNRTTTNLTSKKAVLGFLQEIKQLMSRIKFVDQRFTPSPDGKTVFFEANGDFLTATGLPYRNVYAFRFDIEDGKFIRVTEYANPVTIAVTFGMKLGKEAQ